MHDFDKTVTKKLVKKLGSPVYIGEGGKVTSIITRLKNENEKNIESAREICLNKITEFIKSKESLGKVIVFKQGWDDSYKRYEQIQNHCSTDKVRQLLGYKKVTFTQKYTFYEIITKNKTVERATGDYEFTTNDYGNISGLKQKTKYQQIDDYYYNEEEYSYVIDIYVKIVKENKYEEIQKQEKEFISEHDYYLLKDSEINTDSNVKKINRVLVPFVLSMFFSILCFLFSLCSIKTSFLSLMIPGLGNITYLLKESLLSIPFVKTIIEPYSLIWILVTFIPCIWMGILFLVRRKEFKNIKAGKDILEKRKKPMLIVFWILFIATILMALATLCNLPVQPTIEESFLGYLLVPLLYLIGFIPNGIMQIPFIIPICVVFALVVAIIYLIGCFNGFYGVVNDIDKIIKGYSKEIANRKESGRFEELEKLRKKIIAANISFNYVI